MSCLMPISDPTAEAISIDDAKAQMRVTDDVEDYYISTLIKDVREEFEGLTGHSVMSRTWELTYDSFPDNKIVLEMPPIISVESVKYLDTDDVEQTLATSVYKLVTASNTNAWLELKDGQVWPSTIAAGNAVVISFTAGYAGAASVPNIIKRWMKMVITDWFNNRESENMIDTKNINRSIAQFKDWNR